MKKYLPLVVMFFGLGACLGFAKTADAQTIPDSDGDGLTDQQELEIFYTDPANPDTDGDGFDDRLEIERGYSPWHAEPIKLKQIDSDKDGLSDHVEIRLGSDIRNADTDSDGHFDSQEVYQGFSPTSPSTGAVEKKIVVDIDKFSLSYYFNGRELDSVSVSTGTKYMPTPKGNFEILDKVPVKIYGGQGYNFYYPNTRWNLHFTTGKNRLRYFIHGAYWHNQFGRQNVSSGCVNVRYPDMEPLYKFAQIGTKLEIK